MTIGNEFSRLALPAVILVSITSLVLLTSNRWRWSLFALALQYVGEFILVALSWPFALSLVKIVTGWMVILVLMATMLSERSTTSVLQKIRKPGRYWVYSHSQPGGIYFRLFAAGLIGLMLASAAPRVAAWMPGGSIEQVWGGLILLGIGLLMLGLTANPLRVVFGLFTVLSGFEVFYALVETATLVAGLLAAVNLGLALVGAYLLISPSLRENQ